MKDVIVQQDDLITRIKSDQQSRVKIEEPILFNIYTIPENQDQSPTKLNDAFTHSLVLINALLRLKSPSKDNQQLITLCKNKYKDNSHQLDMIRKFKHEYTPDKALWWYTRESFLYRMLNEALRVQDIDLLLLFRFVISDVYNQLKQNQYKSPTRVYCGQIMTTSELRYLRRSVHGFISINSFFLTTTDRDKALDFLNDSPIDNYHHRILFIIDVDSNVVTTKPFADINKISSFIETGEILFMIGCIFRLIEINEEGTISMMQMKLCDDNEPELQRIFEYMNKINGNGNVENQIDLRTFGDILRQMGKYDLAENIYRLALTELPSNDPLLSEVYCALGVVSKDRNDYTASLKWYQKSLEIKMRTNPSDFINIGNIYNCIGEAHTRNENDKKALECYKKAIERFQNAHAEDHPHMADIYSNIGSIYKRKKEYSEALKFYEKALAIDNQRSSGDRPNVAKSHNNIGIVYCHLNQYSLAMEHYQISLSIKLKTLPSDHLSVGKSHRNIGHVYDVKGDLQQALTSYKRAAAIFHKLLPSLHPDVTQIDNDIHNVERRLN